ncbi:unnamed protein product [Notodromas monacha]|uniref:SLC26A/SulP transporter domain-containing protein n=1 Tax=Notodromas monacha TaxID=399045 RepID=A0A7R9GF64_9CRUS|nr:unnamed protein product [Notodromas monacha]CAG0918801.1 unnamed protein product [Notodromas monacha]
MELQNLGRSFSATTFTHVETNGVPNGNGLHEQSLEYEVEPGCCTKAYCSKCAASCCTEKTLRRKLPLLTWLKKYSRGDFLGDLIAGITVGLTLVPQVIAFSELANLPAEFVSAPVSAGFISAAAIIIVMSQFKSILGLTGMHGEDAIELIRGLYRRIGSTNLEDLGLGLVCIVFLIALREIRRVQWAWCFSPEIAKKVSQIMHVLSAARNVFLIMLCSIAAYIWDAKSGKWGITLTVDGEVVNVPQRDFTDIVHAAGSAMFVIPLIAIVEHVAVCKSFANRKAVDVNQELIALGMSQLVSSFFRSMPITGSISTSCVNAVSGVRTPLGGLFAGQAIN